MSANFVAATMVFGAHEPEMVSNLELIPLPLRELYDRVGTKSVFFREKIIRDCQEGQDLLTQVEGSLA